MVYRPVQLASGYQSLAGIGFASGFLVSLDGFLVSWFLWLQVQKPFSTPPSHPYF